MAITIEVPETTLVADLDRALERLLTAQLARHGYAGADVVFDTPTKAWAAQLTRPTVDLFLYDLQRSEKPAGGGTATRLNGRSGDTPPPLRIDLLYAITAWAPAVVDEHRLLSQVLAILHSYTSLDDVLGPRLDRTAQPFPVTATIGGARSDGRADFWSAVGGHYKPAVDYAVTLAVESGVRNEAGPDVRSTTIRTRDVDRPRPVATELHTLGGTVRDADGVPLAGAWVAVPGLGRLATADGAGRFRLSRMPTGTHAVEARDAAGAGAALDVVVPGPPLDLVLAPVARRGRGRA